MDELTVGMKVHYVHPNGTHSEASITHIWNKETGVVNLFIHRRDEIVEDYHAPTVVHSQEPKPYTWHFIENGVEVSP